MEAILRNWIDVIVIILLVWSAVKGFRKGFIIELSSLLALVLGIFGAIKFADFTASFLTINVDLPEDYTPLIAFALTFILIVIGVHFLARLVQTLVKMVALNFINRLAGAIFSVLKNALIIAFILFFIESIDQNTQIIPKKTKQESLVYHPFSGMAFNLLPSITNSSYFEYLQSEYNTLKEEVSE